MHEGVGVGEMAEEAERVVKSIGDGNGTVKEEFAKHEGICVKTGFHDVTVDLLRGFQVSALSKQTNNPSFFHSLPHHSSY